MLVTPAPFYLASSIFPTTFSAWDAQVSVDGDGICNIYASLEGAMEDNEDKILCEVATLDGGSKICFIL